MAWCPVCGRYWLVRTGQFVRRGLLGRSSQEVMDPPDMICPACEPQPPPPASPPS